MPLSEKNNSMKKVVFISGLLTLTLFACKEGVQNSNEITADDKHAADSVSKAQQKRVSDSLKRLNPLLILPPDSEYTGDYVDKYKTGIIKFKGFYRFGQRHGIWMSFFPNGLKWSELHYDKGLREGPNVTYFENGKIRYEGFYKNDQQDSVWTYYDTSGALVEKVLYKNDRAVKKLPLK
jgi:hypothetical protein